MITTDSISRSIGRLLRMASAAVLCLGLVLNLAAETARKTFDLPADDATATLKAFTQQSGEQIVYPVEQVRGVKTNPVKGEFATRAALDRMLEGTGLVTVQDAKTGALAIKREEPSLPNAPRVAQEEATTPKDQSKVEDGKVVLDKYEVNGTRITGVINQGIVPREENKAVRYNVISREDIDRSGVTSLPELMRRVTSNQETGTASQRTFALSATASGNFIAAGDVINLRGFGNGQTLVMINGRRLYGSDGGGADINRIPLAAIERVEILPSSGSAIYGANSGGGVVNVILRSGYHGTEFTTYVGTSTDGGAAEERFDLFHGISFNGGRSKLTLSLSFGHQDDLRRDQRDYDVRALQNPNAQPGTNAFTSIIAPMLLARRGMIVTSSPLGLGIASNPAVKFAAVPAGSSGLGLTPDSFAATAGTPSVSTERLGRTLLRNPSTSEAVVLILDHAMFGDKLGFYTELTWREDYAPLSFPPANLTVSLSATDPLNPFRTNVTPGFVGRAITVMRDQADLPDDTQEGRRRTIRTVAGFKGRWATAGGRAYSWSLDGSWDSNDSETKSLSHTAILPAAKAGVYNIFRDLTGAPRMSESDADKFAYTGSTMIRPSILAGNARLNGDLFGLWGGPAKFSLVVESRRETYKSSTQNSDIGEYLYLPGGNASLLTNPTPTATIRNFVAVGGEIELPVISERNHKPWLHSLEFSAGTRYEKNTGYVGAAPPLAAMKLGVTRDIAFRASYQEGFQPPALISITAPVFTTTNVSSANYVDALRPGILNPNYTVISSGNPDLRPETAKTWEAGVILTPRWLKGLTINATYFRSDKQDVVTSLNLTTAITSYPDLVVRDLASAADIAAGMPGPVNTFYSKPVNISRQFTDGIEWSARYDMAPTPYGHFVLTSGGTWTKRFFTQSRPGQPNVDALGLAPFSSNFALKTRTNASVLWSRDAWAASVTGNYTGSFESSSTTSTARNPSGTGIDGTRIPSALTFDVQVSYSIPPRHGQSVGWLGWLGGTKWSVGALNAFNKEPALWTDRIRGFYSPLVDPRQCFVYLQIKKTL